MLTDDFEVKAGGGENVPNGVYVAKYRGVQRVTSDKYEGERLRWEFEVVSGPLVGKVLTALTDTTPTTSNQTGVIVAGLAGRRLAPGDKPKSLIDAAVGKVFLVGFRPGSKGGRPGVRSVDDVPPGM